MIGKVFAIRPQPGLSATLSAGRALGLDIQGEPLFEILPAHWDVPDPATIDALLIGSANAIRHGGPQLDLLRSKPVYAVGKMTADLAIEAGFSVERIGNGGMQSLLQPGNHAGSAPMRFLRLCGAERVALDVPGGVSVEERTVYQAAPTCILPNFAKLLQSGGIVLLHSAAAARHFADECARLGIATNALVLAALGPRVTEDIGGDWGGIHHAASPNDSALLALAKDMCQDP